jgi:hypothetical protein
MLLFLVSPSELPIHKSYSLSAFLFRNILDRKLKFKSFCFSEKAAQMVENPPLEGTVTPICAATDTCQMNEMAECEMNGRDPCFSWFYSRPKISRLEIRAALSMSINVLPVWLCTFPVTLNAIAIYWCFCLQINCPVIMQINPYITDLFLLDFIYNPLMYMSSSTEFKRALVRLKHKFKI